MNKSYIRIFVRRYTHCQPLSSFMPNYWWSDFIEYLLVFRDFRVIKR